MGSRWHHAKAKGNGSVPCRSHFVPLWRLRGSRRLTAQLGSERLLEALPMLIPTLTIRRCILVGFMLVSLLVLADSAAHSELQRAMGDMAFVMSGGASGE